MSFCAAFSGDDTTTCSGCRLITGCGWFHSSLSVNNVAYTGVCVSGNVAGPSSASCPAPNWVYYGNGMFSAGSCAPASAPPTSSKSTVQYWLPPVLVVIIGIAVLVWRCMRNRRLLAEKQASEGAPTPTIVKFGAQPPPHPNAELTASNNEAYAGNSPSHMAVPPVSHPVVGAAPSRTALESSTISLMNPDHFPAYAVEEEHARTAHERLEVDSMPPQQQRQNWQQSDYKF